MDSLSPSYCSLIGVSQRLEPAKDKTELPGDVRRLLNMSELYSDGARLLEARFRSFTVFMMFLFCSLHARTPDLVILFTYIHLTELVSMLPSI